MIITFVAYGGAGEGEQADKLARVLRPLEWLTDISWTVEICLNFVSADHTHRSFKGISLRYLRFWFWIDAIATFPNMYYLEENHAL